MAIVWPCSMSVDEYVAAGRDLEIPRPDCPSCSAQMTFWSGYWRYVRDAGRCSEMWVRRARCEPCSETHALLPAFLLTGRLDVVETVGQVLDAVVGGTGGVRPAASAVAVPHTTARGWLRRFFARAKQIAVAFGALAVELGGEALTPQSDLGRRALSAIYAAYKQATALGGWLSVGRWRFCAAVCGGALVSTNTNSPYLVVGRRRFMPPVA